MSTVGAVIWFEIWVADLERAKEFYGGLFGWTFEPLSGYDAENYWRIVPASQTVNGALVRDPDRAGSVGRSSVLYVHVADLEEAVARAQKLGATLVQGRTKITDEAGTFALVADPDGNQLGLWVP